MSDQPNHPRGNGSSTPGGSGPKADAAKALRLIEDMNEQIGSDSGYVGSDAPSPILDPSDTPERSQARALNELTYNLHRGKLARYINEVIETLKDVQRFNTEWPLHYPSVQQVEAFDHLNQPRPHLVHTSSTAANARELEPPRPGALRRWETSVGEAQPESSRAAELRAAARGPHPEYTDEVAEGSRLLTAQAARRFAVLKLDLKLGSLHQADLIHSMERASVASILDGEISSSIKHLFSLRERIEDTSSKVLVTGDVNTGKSTFCNALLRRKILPEKQGPCTNIFCEVLAASENGGIEEVHAVYKDAEYNRHDESTYDRFALKDLEKIFQMQKEEAERYTHCKVYVVDVRTIDESLLNNGVVDIALIDAPGLNTDAQKTLAVFARQEEIDVVVFVVDARNTITESAQNFIGAAAAEKAYIFIVVNGYDVLRSRSARQDCQTEVLKQINKQSPHTFKESKELVHFVSSIAVPTAPLAPGGGGPGGDPDHDDESEDDTPINKGKQKEKERDFETLERSLRRFVLEKRAQSKLTPAKTFMMQLLGDVDVIAKHNLGVAQSELDRVTHELEELEPLLKKSEKAKDKVSNDLHETIEDTCKEIYDYTRTTLNSNVNALGDEDFGVEYPGLLSAFNYAEDLKRVMLQQISTAVTICEEHARERSVDGVAAIQALGLRHIGDKWEMRQFRKDMMFKRRRDELTRQVHVETEWTDFFDWNTVMQQQEKVAGTGMAMTVVTVAGTKMLGGMGWVDGALGAARLVGGRGLKRMIVPGMLAIGKLRYSPAVIYNVLTRFSHRCNSLHPLPNPTLPPPPPLRKNRQTTFGDRLCQLQCH